MFTRRLANTAARRQHHQCGIATSSSSSSSATSQQQICSQKRFLNIHEYQAKQLMERFHVSHQRGITVDKVEDVKAAALEAQQKFNTKNLIVKSQILAGGRGKGTFDTGYQGGVKFCTSPEKAEEVSKQMLGNRLTTIQTPKDGIEVRKVFVAECLDFKREMYFAILLDRASDGAVIIASTEGGVDIEEVAEKNPEAIAKCVVEDFEQGPTDAQVTDLVKNLGFDLSSEQAREVSGMVKNLYQLFTKTDATLLEVNPLVETIDGRVVCIDAKINFDDNAEFRQQEIFSWRDFGEEDPREVDASKAGLNYVGLEGNIGCMVNGAGLAMATMDVLDLHGGKPANFLDVGGGANKDQIISAFRVLTSDKNVQAILVNIFGGIMRCDTIVSGLLGAAQELSLTIPIVVRVEGTNAELARKMLRESGINVIPALDLDDAAKKAVATIKE